jgi:DNA end-binding protein Ku
LRLSLVSLPVKAYAAVSSTSTTHFHLLHDGCGQRISYTKHCPQHGPVEADAIVKGYEYAPDHYVIVEPQELEQLRPPRDKALVLEQFVAVAEVPPTFFAGRCLYLVPDGAAAQHPYGVLVEALQHAGRAALGRVVLCNSRQLVLVRALGRLLMLDVLHYPAQVRSSTSWEAELPPCTASAAERDLAAQLLALASAPVDWTRYRDTSAEELAALVEAKRVQQAPPSAAEEPVVLQLLDALKQSVAAVQHGTAAANGTPAKPRKAQGSKARGKRATG